MEVMGALGRTTPAGSTRRARRSAVSTAGRWFHLLGAFALILGMFLPLTDVGQALANPGIAGNQAFSREQQDTSTTAFTRVVAVGDFQGQYGCSGFDVFCDATRLTNHDGLWTGSFNIPPGTWQWQIVAQTQDGQEFAFDTDGISTQPETLTLGEGEVGAFFAFDAATQEASVSAIPAIVELRSDIGTYAMAFDNGAWTAIIQAPQGGQVNAEMAIDGAPSGIPLSIPVEEGPNEVTLDGAGSLLDVESLGYATLTVDRIDGATDQPIGGGCYEVVRNNETLSRGCDTDDGMANGSITMSFPSGFEPGPVTVRETSAPDGVETAPDQDVDLQYGDSRIEIRTGEAIAEPTEEPAGDGGIVGLPGDEATEEATDETDAEPTAPLEEPTAEPTEPVVEPTAEPVPGDLYVTLVDQNGERIGGACFELVDVDGNVVGQTCDTEDAFPFNGVAGFTGIPEGDYTLRQTTAPENTEPASEQQVSIVGGIENTLTVTGALAQPTPEPTGNIVVLRGDDGGQAVGGACFQLLDASGTPVGEPVCDEDGDVADDGRIGFFDVEAGTYTLRETRTPDGVEPAADTPVEVQPGGTVEVPIRSARIVVDEPTPEPTAEPTAEPKAEPTVEPTAEPTAVEETPEPTATEEPEAEATEEPTAEAIPGSLIITLQDQDGQPIGGACFELRQGETVLGPICDADDPFPGNGNTGFFNVPSGTYTLHQTTVPEGTQAVPEQEVGAPAGDQQTVIVQAPAAEATEEPTEVPTEEATEEPTEEMMAPQGQVAPGTGSLIVDLSGLSLDGATVCIELNTAGGIGFLNAPGACDNGEGDSDPTSGVIRLDNVSPGSYALFFIDGPQDLTSLDPEQVTIEEGQVAQMRIGPETVGPQAPEPGTINVVFQTGDTTRVEVEGGCITTDRLGTSVCDNGEGDNDPALGVISVPNPEPGNVTVTIESAPNGYTATQTSFSLAVGAGQVETVPVTVERETTSFTVLTVDAADTNVALEGACYTVDGGNETCDDADGESDGIVTFAGVVPGEQTVAQTVAPAGYEQVTDTQTATVAADGTTRFVFQNTAETATLEITTRAAGGGDVLTGACYTLEDGPTVCDADDGADDGVVTFGDVRVGTYRITQTTTPAGYEQAAALTDVNVASGLNQVTVENFPLTGSIVTEIVDEAGNPIGEPGALGVCVTIEGFGDRCDGGTEDAAPDIVGTIRTNGVPIGTYNVTVLSVLEGYDIPTDVQVAEVTAGADATVRFTILETPPATGHLNVRVQFADDDALIQGVCVTVTSTVDETVDLDACDNGEGDTNGEAGIIGFTDLQIGTYLVALADGTQIDGGDVENTVPVSVDILADTTSTATLEVPRVPTTGTLRIVTTDGAANIGGAAYRITGDGYDVTIADNDGSDADGTDGVIQVGGLAPGEYTISMTTTPAGYGAAGNQSATIAAGETTTVEIALTATPNPGSLVVRTLDEAGDPLTNACYALNQGGVRIVEACDSADGANDGTTRFADLSAGTYQLVQTRTPDTAYATAPAQNVTINAGEETVVEITMSERPGRLVVITVDSADTSVRLDNACYSLSNGTTFGPFCDADDGNVDGRVIFSNVPAGQYTLTETVAPTGFQAAPDRTVTIPAGGSLQVTVANARIPLPEATGTLVVIPLDPNGSEVAGGCYQVFDGDTAITDRICDNADDQPRRITFTGLPVGTYTVVERLAPSPDYLIADPMSVTIERDTTTELRVPHQLKPGRLLIQAVNSTGLPLQGACFDVSNDGQGPLCTTTTGEILVTDLEPGTRTITQTQAPFGYRLNETPRDVTILPGQTTVVRIVFEVEPPPNTGTVQVQKFVCPAGEDGERTMFLGGAQGNAQLQQTVGCVPAVAEFTLDPEDGPDSNYREFATTTEGRYQVTVEEGIYVLTETNPDLPGNSAARLRVGVGQMTMVIVINFIAPPEPEPASINVEAYTCPPSFNGTTYDDFAASCVNDSSPTNQITVRAEGESRFKQVTGDGGVVGVTSFDEIPAGTYAIYAEKPFTVPLMYMFCGGNANYPADYKVINGTVSTTLDNGEEITCKIFLIPEQMSAETGAVLVQKYSCPIDSPVKGYDFQGECSRSEDQVVFDLAVFNAEMQDFEPLARVAANADGIVRFPDLRPGTYRLTEVDGQWCFAQSNSVNANGDVVVQANKLSEVWVYNCVGTKEPPNTGSGDAAHLLDGGTEAAPAALPAEPRKAD